MQNLLQFTKIGWIGTGVMGKPMCEHLMNAGYTLHVYNRTKSKTDELINKGASFHTPEEIAKNCEVVFLMLGYPHDVRKMVLDEFGIIKNMRAGSILVDHTTSSPSLAREIYEKCLEKGIHSVDAPVSGGDIGARTGKLCVMAGGDKKSFDAVLPLLEKYSISIKHMGDAGKGQHTKMVNQICIANNMMGVVEGLLYGHKAGLPLHDVIEAIENGAAGSFSLKVLGRRMLKRDFDPGFYVEHFVKDMEIALEEARRANLCLPGLSMVHQFYEALIAQGGAKLGTQGILTVLEKLSNTQIPKQEKKEEQK